MADTRLTGGFPEDCLKQHAQKTETRELPVDVTKALSEDVTYRLKEITHNAIQFMKHSNRQKLTADDISRALKWSDVDPVVGLSSSSVVSEQTAVEEGSRYTLQDKQVSLENVSSDLPSVKKPTLQGSWLCLEGELLDPSAVSVSYERNPIEAEEKYLHLLTDAIQGDNEDIRRTAFVDIRSNGSITAILPELVQFVLNSVDSRYHLSALQLHRAMRTLLAIAGNPNLYIEPYVPRVVEGMLLITLEPLGYKSQERTTDWMVRDLGALCLAEYLKHMVTSSAKLQAEVQCKLEDQLGLSTLNCGSAFGAISIACYMGKQVVMESVWPHLSKLHNQIESILESSSDDMRSNAAKLHEVLLVAAQMILIGDGKKEADKVSTLQEETSGTDMDTNTAKLHPKTTTAEIHEKLYDLYGETLVSRMIAATSSHNAGSTRIKRDEIAKTDDTRPSGSTTTFSGESAGFTRGPRRVEMEYCQTAFSYQPVVHFSHEPKGISVNPWNILDPDTYEMYVKQQQVFRQHLQKQHGEQKVTKGKMKTTNHPKEHRRERISGKKSADKIQLNNAWL